jgi:hypothetical protein
VEDENHEATGEINGNTPIDSTAEPHSDENTKEGNAYHDSLDEVVENSDPKPTEETSNNNSE